uniref:Sec16 Sec23-binding domain-containing protein n=1 Tax=Oryza punctata TaxID=4537 RepID=A0A0E0LP96_ORYPU
MACIKSAQRAALTALAPEAPYLAAGTMSGAVDMLFSASANIEIFRLDFQSDSPDLPLLASAPSPDRFNRLSWSRPGAADGDSFSLGLLAGGLSDGSVAVWNPLSMINSEGKAEDALVARLEKHTGPVCGLEFSELTPNRLASGAEQGELCIWDLKNPSEPVVFPPLKSVGSSAQAEISYLTWNPKFQHILATASSNGMTDSNRTKCSVLQWNPDMSTQLIVASDDDNSPSLRVWDVRKTISPVREFVGHSKGVIAMSWCPYDSSYLLTCSKDNRTICWDTVSGEIMSELPASSNGNFDIHWYRKIPGVVAASSFDVKIGIYNLEFSGLYAAGDSAIGAPARPRAPAPKWLKCPTGASFGFGGKLVSFHQAAPTQGAQVHVHNLVIEQSLVSRSTEFEAAIQNGDKSSLRALCDKKAQESLSDEERETWGFLRVMFEDGDAARTKLLAHLGFNPPQEQTSNSTDELNRTLADTLNLDHGTPTDTSDSQFMVDNGEDFFNNPQPSEASLAEESISTNGQQIEQEMPVNVEPSDPSVDKSIQHALVVGDYKGAVNQCLAANRMADALVIAHAGGSALWESTRNQYLKNTVSPYLKVVSAMVGNDLMSFVSTWPLNAWKETLALLCTFARKEEWNVLCDTLASRLLGVGDTLAATLCYICAGNIDKAVEIWSRDLKSEDGGKTYVDLLQDLMEKTITLALATGHKSFSASLSKLVENYAELLASQGLLKTAMEYLKLLGSDEHSHELAILRDRIAFSTEENHAASTSVHAGSINSSTYPTIQPSYSTPEPSQNLYQGASQYTVPNNQYQDYQQQPNTAYGTYTGAYSQQPTQMFVPSNTTPVITQPNATPAPVPQQPVKAFTPTNLPGLKNPEQYQQPTLGSQLYAGANPPYTSGQPTPYHGVPPTTYHQPRPPAQFQTVPQAPPAVSSATVPGTTPSQMFPGPVVNNPTSRFMPSNNPGFVQRPGLSPVQPSSPTQAQGQPQPVVAPPAPPPTVQTADTSKVSAELKPVIATLTRLFDETSKAMGGSQVKKREIEDNSRKIGALFAKLNSGDISPNVSSKLIQLCSALDSGDFATAMHLQVLLTTSDWDECNFWLAALKRMIKTRQNFRM